MMKKVSAVVGALGAAVGVLVLYRMSEWPVHDTPGVLVKAFLMALAAAQLVPMAGVPIFLVLSRRWQISRGAKCLWWTWLVLSALLLVLGAMIGGAL